MKFDINNILVIGIILVVILMVCLKCLDIQNNLQEHFDDHNESGTPENEVTAAEGLLESNAALSELNNNNSNDSNNNDSDDVENMTSAEKADLRRKCAALEDKPWGSVVSKYSGKTINVEVQGERDGDKLYMIKWHPLGGKPGGCITLEANGTYSTPLCNPNIDKQKWIIRKITSEKNLRDVIPKERQNMGRAIEETPFPFYMIISGQDKNYALNYEGGGISIRPTANYDGQKWDVSEKKIVQDPLPTQKNNKFTSLTPEHNMSSTDKSMSGVMTQSSLGSQVQSLGGSNGNKGADGSVNLNVNLDPDLLAKLGLALGSDGNLQNLNEKLNQNQNQNQNGNSKMDDFFVDDTKTNSTGGRGNVDEMLKGGQGNPNCKDCDKIPDRYIKKDLVKSTCIGCDNIDNVLS